MTTYRVTVERADGEAVNGHAVQPAHTEMLRVTVDATGPLDLPGIIFAIQRTKRVRKSRAKQPEAAS